MAVGDPADFERLYALLGFTLLLSLTLEHPFSGPDAISSSHFTTGALSAVYEPSG